MSALGPLAFDCTLTRSSLFCPLVFSRRVILTGFYEFSIATDMKGNTPRIH